MYTHTHTIPLNGTKTSHEETFLIHVSVLNDVMVSELVRVATPNTLHKESGETEGERRERKEFGREIN